MEITIDTKNKTVELKEDTNVIELVQFLENAKDAGWKEYKILATKDKTEYIPYYPCVPCPSPTPLQPYYVTTIDMKV